MAETDAGFPRWAPAASLVLGVLGLADAAYLTFEHYTGSKTLACSSNGIVNCHAVTTSRYATFLGMPVALLGLLFFVALVALCLPPLWRTRTEWVHVARLAAAGLGVVSVLYLLWAELFKLDKICLYCTGVHVLTFALFAVVALAGALRRS
ncbi:MAG: Vitamin epoxide reductase [Marmoricola sp.]|jgi:uncharacterized membrane protein|nr:Vitamin epoxide reductase [Marmoricola sp.]